MVKLVVVYVEGLEDKRSLSRIEKALDKVGLRLLPHLFLTWRSEREVEKALYDVKNEVIRRMELGDRRATIETAVIDLSNDQYNRLKPLVVRRIESWANRLAEEATTLTERVRSYKGRKSQMPKSLVQEYRRINKEFDQLIRVRSILDVYPTAIERLIEAVKVLRAEF